MMCLTMGSSKQVAGSIMSDEDWGLLEEELRHSIV